MATPADQRLLELLEKWLKSLDLHAKYSSLDDDSYRQIQPWPPHQRPSRWIIDLARQKAAALETQIQERVKMGDVKFSESLELSMFLANLVGSEHIERFIPMATAETERVLGLAPPDGRSEAAIADASTGTREMPRFEMVEQRAPAGAGTAKVVRTERTAPAERAAPAAPAERAERAAPAERIERTERAAPDAKPPAKSAGKASDRYAPSEAAREQVIADAARLVQWGRKWYELAELIARMADRPPLTDVRRILKDNKTIIDERAARG